MAIEIPTAEKRPWVDGAMCRDRPVHCAHCPYVLARPIAYGTMEWVFPIKDVYCEDDGSLVFDGVEDRFTPPPNRRCPWGITFPAARSALAQRVVQRVARGEISEQQAEDYLTKMQIDLEAAFTRDEL